MMRSIWSPLWPCGRGASFSAPQRLVLAPSGNEARYRVREQLANVSFPSDAVGTTQGVTGAIVIGDDGKIVTAQSSIVVDLTTLKSDRERRDRFIQGRTLETDRFPTATLVPTAARGWPSSLPNRARSASSWWGISRFTASRAPPHGRLPLRPRTPGSSARHRPGSRSGILDSRNRG